MIAEDSSWTVIILKPTGCKCIVYLLRIECAKVSIDGVLPNIKEFLVF